MTTPTPESPERPPITPLALLAACLVAAVIVWNLYLDAGSDGYDGEKTTYALIFGMLFILGVDLGRGRWRK